MPGEASLKSRKEQDTNWTKAESLALVCLKREECMEDTMVEDTRDLMNLETTRWGKIAKKLNCTSIVEYS